MKIYKIKQEQNNGSITAGWKFTKKKNNKKNKKCLFPTLRAK